MGGLEDEKWGFEVLKIQNKILVFSSYFYFLSCFSLVFHQLDLFHSLATFLLIFLNFLSHLLYETSSKLFNSFSISWQRTEITYLIIDWIPSLKYQLFVFQLFMAKTGKWLTILPYPLVDPRCWNQQEVVRLWEAAGFTFHHHLPLWNNNNPVNENFLWRHLTPNHSHNNNIWN